MKRVAVCFVLSFASLSSIANAASWADGLFSQLRHDFGSIPRGADVRCSFVITNTTPTTVRITAMRRTCGCTLVTLDDKVVLDQNTEKARDNKVIAPGQQAQIGVVLDTRKFIGAKSAEITVYFDQPNDAEVRLTVSSFIRQDIVFNPGAIELGSLSRGQEASRELEIEYAGQANWQIRSVTNPNPDLIVKYDEMYRRPGQVGYKLAVSLKPDVNPGLIRETLIIETNDPGAPQFPVLVTGQVQGELIITPQTLSFGTVRPGETATRQVLLRSKKPFQIVNIEGGNEAFQIEKPRGQQTFHKMTVKFTGEDVGANECTFRVQTDLNDTVAEFKASVQVVR